MAENPWIRSGGGAKPLSLPTPPSAAPAPAPSPVTVSAPQAGVPVPDMADRLPRREQHASATIWWLGTHGGAGESTLAGLAAGSRAADHAWPTPGLRGTHTRVVLVARTNFAGLTSAQRAAREWASGSLGEEVQLLGLVLMADQPGRLPKELRQLVQLVSGGVPRTWSLPWVDAWRFGPVVASSRLPKELASLFDDLSLKLNAPRS